jgi:hypothetical protein
MQGVNTRPGVDQQFAIDRAPDGVIEASDSSLAHAGYNRMLWMTSVRRKAAYLPG